MTNWLQIDPQSPQCCVVSIATRKGRPDPFKNDGGTFACPECGRVWKRVGDELKEAE